MFFKVLQVAEKRSDVVWIMSDIIFPASYVVFPTSYIVFGLLVLRHLQGRMAYALHAAA